MARLIDADAFECVCVNGKSDDFCNGVLYVLDMIDAQSTVDAVEVVRCKDCKNSGVMEYTGKRYCKYPIGCLGCTPTESDNFCSYGERKE